MDDIANQIAAEEHLQGKPVGERGHCSYCNEAADAIAVGIRQAKCQHEEWIEHRTGNSDVPVRRACVNCGRDLEIERG